MYYKNLGDFDEEEDMSLLRREDLPVWHWASLVTPDSFIDIPPNFALATAGPAATGEPKKDKPFYRYARVKTQRCVDSELLFCETLAIVYASIQEGLGDKVFLKGNAFLAKIAKAIFEQNGNLFAEACAKHKGDEYFRECAGELEKLDFKAEKDKKIGKDSWLAKKATKEIMLRYKAEPAPEFDEDRQGLKIKARSGWIDGGNGTDEYGFATLPGGLCYSSGNCYDAGSEGHWWTATQFRADNALKRKMSYENEYAFYLDGTKTDFFSVRCIKK